VTAGRYRWLIIAGAVAAVVVLFVVLRGGGDDGTETNAATTTTPATTTSATPTEEATTTEATTTSAVAPTIVNVEVSGGKVVGGPQTHEVPFKKRLVLVVTSDIADEVHVHGYDLMKDVEAGGTVRFSFVTNLSGTFEFELEDEHLRLGELSVPPS
jgi:hypothetical protein